jgi:hypothetical protein
MARSKTILLYLILACIIACDDDRHLPAEPSITFNKIQFVESDGTGKPDLLILSIDFQDGDGDLGLLATDIGPPYHPANYFYDDNGKVLTIRSRSNPKYAFLPPYEYPFICTHYTDPKQTTYLPASVVDNTFNIVETIKRSGVEYHGVQDMVYFEVNPDHFNITVDFLVWDGTGFTEFDFRKEFCNQSFDGRFPPLQDDDRALEGTLSYTMTSFGFKTIFRLKRLKLRIAIKDRALHESRVIETPEFSL